MEGEMYIDLPEELEAALKREASDARRAESEHIIEKLQAITPSVEYIDKKPLKKNLPKLAKVLGQFPAVEVLSHKVTSDAYWWVKFDIDLTNPLAWRVIQELGFIFNSYTVSEPLPTILKPVSPPPYMNGGPEDFLSWIVESTYNYIDPDYIVEILQQIPATIE